MRFQLIALMCLVSGLAGCVTESPVLSEGQQAAMRSGAFGAIRIPPGGVMVSLGQDSAYYAL